MQAMPFSDCFCASCLMYLTIPSRLLFSFLHASSSAASSAHLWRRYITIACLYARSYFFSYSIIILPPLVLFPYAAADCQRNASLFFLLFCHNSNLTAGTVAG